jgi:hypothetical protein
MSEEFLFCNPFLSVAVDETTIWAEEGSDLLDIETINTAASQQVENDIELVRRDPQHTTRCRFLVGGAGAGKSHLFSRLRRRLGGRALFTFASNPPQRPAALLGWIVAKVMAGMTRAWIAGGGRRPYSQLDAFLYLLVVKEKLGLDLSLDELHRFWSEEVHEAARADYLKRLHERLVASGYDPELSLGLLAVLRPETRATAIAWLSGEANLPVDQLATIGQTRGIEDEEMLELLERLGDLSTRAQMPIVLVLDQLDLMTRPEQLAELQRMLFSLINASRNWYVVIGLLRDKFELWQSTLTDALQTRVVDPATGVLPLMELQPIAGAAAREALLRARLATVALARLRAQAGIEDPLFPLTAADIAELSQGAGYARELIRKASARYTLKTQPASAPPIVAEPLASFVETLFREHRDRIDPLELRIDKAELADRLEELIEVVAIVEGATAAFSPGPLESDPRYRGTDTVVRIDGVARRLVTHHIHQGRQFSDFLSKVLPLPARSVFVRDAVVPTTGAVSTARLTEFRKDKQFIHLPRPQIADLQALGEILAELRGLNYAAASTDPPPTPDNVKRCLGQLPALRQHDVARAFFAAATEALTVEPGAPATATGSQSEAPEPATPAMATIPPVTATTSHVAAIRAVMRSARWLVLERLRRQIEREHGLALESRELRSLLAAAPLRSEVTAYPIDLFAETDIHILIWAEGEGLA